ncbi:helix-turn-helix domain-containing protein [Nocardia sp. NPDC052278]|uniref:helix-turn-helix domain-containing protein n=1 Tax=unclassified Nocardia TaxID=2637762 RepID=UPI0036CA891E
MRINVPGEPSLLQVVEFFDELLVRGSDLDTVLDSAARFAECSVGYRSADKTIDIAAHSGEPVTGSPDLGGASMRRLPSGDEIWLARRDGTTPLDEVILKRLAATCVAALRHRYRELLRLGDPALVELVVSEAAGEAERARALKLLGYSPSARLRTVAIGGSAEGAQTIAARLGGPSAGVRLASLDRIHILTTTLEVPNDLAVPIGSHVAVGPEVLGIDAPLSWREARSILRFTLPSTHDAPPYRLGEAAITDARRVGCFVLLAHHLTPEAISTAVEVSALDVLTAEPGGADMLRTLEMVAATESLRKAAVMLHKHHNSVGHRVARAERQLGFEISAPYGRVRLMLALVLRRLRDSRTPQ